MVFESMFFYKFYKKELSSNQLLNLNTPLSNSINKAEYKPVTITENIPKPKDSELNENYSHL